jgi:heat shock protein HslJ
VQRLVWKLMVALLTCPTLAMTAETTPETLDGSAWILADLASDSLLEEVTATLAFEAGNVAGTDGCNRFRGPYEFSDGDLRIGQLASTMMACPEDVMRQARAVIAALEQARGTRLEGRSLVLHDDDGEELARFDPQAQTLANTRWSVTGINNGKQAVVSTEQGTSVTLEFDDAGGVGGSAGCNRFRASYTIDGTSISIGEAAATRKMCPESVMTQETAYLQALENSSQLRVEGERLELRDESGALQVSATRAAGAEGSSP